MKNLIPFIGLRHESIDRATGRHAALARNAGWMVEAFSVQFSAGATHWIDDATGELVRYDVESGTRRAVPLDGVAP